MMQKPASSSPKPKIDVPTNWRSLNSSAPETQVTSKHGFFHKSQMRNQLVSILANGGQTFFQVFEWLSSFVFKRQLCKCYPIIVPSIYPICIIIPNMIPNMIPTIIFVYTNLYHVSARFPHHVSHHVSQSLKTTTFLSARSLPLQQGHNF